MTKNINSTDRATLNVPVKNFGNEDITANRADRIFPEDQDVQVSETDKNVDQHKNLKLDRFLIKIFVCLCFLEYLSRILSNIGDFLKNLGLTRHA